MRYKLNQKKAYKTLNRRQRNIPLSMRISAFFNNIRYGKGKKISIKDYR